MTGEGSVPRGPLFALLAAFAFLWFCNLGYRHLVKPDEGRYAEIPREMVASGDWLTPRLNGYKYFEKPPLQYWATAASFRAFGVNEWAARLWPGLTGFLGVLLVFWAGNRLFGPPAGLLGAAVTASSALYAIVGHLLTLDMALSFFMSASVFAFALAQREPEEARRRRWMLVAWAAAALAVLTKGLAGVVLPIGAVGAYVLLERDWKLLSRLYLVRGGLLFLAIAAPWFVMVSLANPEFPRFFFIHEHFERFLTKEHDRYQPVWYFLPVLLLGVVPWVLSLFPALRSAWTRTAAPGFQARRFLLVWCAVVFVFFSVSSSKLLAYILPLFPALALLMGDYLRSAGRGVLLAQAVLAAVLGAALAAAAPQAPAYASEAVPSSLLEGYVPWIVASGLALTAGGVIAAVLAARARRAPAVLCLACGGLVLAQTALSGHESLAPSLSAYHIVHNIRDRLKPDTPFYVVETFDHTLLFYLERKVTMVSVMDELAVPVGREPRDFLPDAAAFARAWEADREPLAMFNANDLPGFLKAHPVPMRIIATDPRRVIVSKP
ncbi:MAG TPA: phospholipid carrier-dependent glycosyltransferase [Burkholderiales bacterium]|nr:phospholipid carrier-dependent glycosyltransferase [Burkholderiales bacterium]